MISLKLNRKEHMNKKMAINFTFNHGIFLYNTYIKNIEVAKWNCRF
jgi:hypothetical protein